MQKGLAMSDEEFGLSLCVHSDREKWPEFSMDREMTVYDSAEICLQICHFLRNYENGISQAATIVDSFEINADEPTDDPKICIMWNPNSRQIRFSITGMPVWDALITLENAATYFRMLFVREEGMEHGRTDNS